MKKAKPETKLTAKEQKEAAESKERRQRLHRCENWGLSPNPNLKILPTPEQLTNIAAVLWQKDKEVSEYKLCAQALQLWVASVDVLEAQSKCAEDREAEFAKFRFDTDKMPDAKQFPMLCEAFLKYAFPTITKAQRKDLFMAYLRDRRTDEWRAEGGYWETIPPDWWDNVQRDYDCYMEPTCGDGSPNDYVNEDNFLARVTRMRRWYYEDHLPRERQKSGSLGGKKNRKIAENIS